MSPAAASESAARHAERIAAPVGVQAVIGRVDGDVTACDINGDRFDPFITIFDVDRPVIDEHVGIGMDAVIPRGDVDHSAADGDVAGGVDGIVTGSNADVSGFDHQVTALF